MEQHQASDIDRELTQMMNDWFASIKRGDSSWFERVMADDWTYVMIDGSLRNKAWYVERVSQPFDGEISAEIHELRARTYGGVAVANGHYTVKGVRGGVDMSSHARFTAVWRKQGGSWQALAHHATRILE